MTECPVVVHVAVGRIGEIHGEIEECAASDRVMESGVAWIDGEVGRGRECTVGVGP